MLCSFFFFFSSRRRHTRSKRDWSSDVCSSDLHFMRLVADLDLVSHRARDRPLAVADLRGRGGDRRLRRLGRRLGQVLGADRKSTRLNSSHVSISYAVFFLKKKNAGTLQHSKTA